MIAPDRRPSLSLLVGLVLVALIGAVLMLWSRVKDYVTPLPVYGQVTDFQLTNQLGEAVSIDALRGRVWVADVIFTRCPLACGQMTKRMNELQQALPSDTAVRLVSLTTDPEHDTPEVLHKFGKEHGAEPSRWWFLTGSSAQVGNLLTNGLRLTAVANAPEQRTNPNDLFTHSTVFLVVDQRGRIREAVEALEPGWKDDVLKAVGRLLREG